MTVTLPAHGQDDHRVVSGQCGWDNLWFSFWFIILALHCCSLFREGVDGVLPKLEPGSCSQGFNHMAGSCCLVWSICVIQSSSWGFYSIFDSSGTNSSNRISIIGFVVRLSLLFQKSLPLQISNLCFSYQINLLE